MTTGCFTQYMKWKIVKITTSIALLRLTIFLKFTPVGTYFFWIRLLRLMIDFRAGGREACDIF